MTEIRAEDEELTISAGSSSILPITPETLEWISNTIKEEKRKERREKKILLGVGFILGTVGVAAIEVARTLSH